MDSGFKHAKKGSLQISDLQGRPVYCDNFAILYHIKSYDVSCIIYQYFIFHISYHIISYWYSWAFYYARGKRRLRRVMQLEFAKRSKRLKDLATWGCYTATLLSSYRHGSPVWGILRFQVSMCDIRCRSVLSKIALWSLQMFMCWR